MYYCICTYTRTCMYVCICRENQLLQVGEYNRLNRKSSVHRAHWSWQGENQIVEKRIQGGEVVYRRSLEEREWRHSSKQWWHVTGIVRAGTSLYRVVIRFSIAMNRACFDQAVLPTALRPVSSNPEDRHDPSRV